jgi:flagella basal body P-ring formation protein FlgA
MRYMLLCAIVVVAACGAVAEDRAPGVDPAQPSAADTRPNGGCCADAGTGIGQLLRVTLNTSGSVRGQYIRLRDVASVDGVGCAEGVVEKALDTCVGTASVPGAKRTLTRDDILVRLRGAGFRTEEIEFLGPEKIEVLREAQTVSAGELRDLALQAVQQKLPWPSEDVTVEVVREPEDLTVGQGALEVRVDPGFGYRGFGQGIRGFSTVSVPIEVLLDGQQCKRVTVPIRVRAYATVAVAAADIARNDVISEEMVTMTRVDLSASSGEVILDQGRAIGKRATRSIRAGQPITAAMIEEPPALARGDTVTVVSRSGAVTARSTGEALKEGRVGDTIPVRVAEAKKELQAVVIDANTVEVHP